MSSISHHQFAQEAAEQLQRAEAGEAIVVTRNGRPVAELRPIDQPPLKVRPTGLCAGEFQVPDDFDEPLPENVLSEFEKS